MYFFLQRNTNYEEVDSSGIYWTEEMLIVLLEHTNDFKIIHKNIYKLYKNHINYPKYQDAHFLYEDNNYNELSGYYFIKGKYNISNKIFVIREFESVDKDTFIGDLKNKMIRNLALSGKFIHYNKSYAFRRQKWILKRN